MTQVSETVLVDFWGAWCGPCRAMNPTIEVLARYFKVCKVNVDTNQELAVHFGNYSIPAEVMQTILDFIEPFCLEPLNEEYAEVCRKLAEKLDLKRPLLLPSGHAHTWASGIVRTIGWVNFLGDPTQTPHVKMTDIDESFGVSENSGPAKSKATRDLLRLRFIHIIPLVDLARSR